MTPRSLVLAAALALTTGCTALTTYAVDRNYNRFTDETRVLLRPQPLTVAAASDGLAAPPLTLAASFSSKGLIDVQRPETITLALETKGKEWHFKDQHDLSLLVDGTTLSLGTLGHDGTRHDGYCFEYMWAEVPVATIEALAQADSISGRLGDYEFRLDATLMQRLREFAERIPPADRL